MKYTNDTEVTFSLSIGFPGANREETQTLLDLGIDVKNYDTDEEIEEEISELVQEWTTNYIDYGWYAEEDD